jgi:hypothetical protein
MKSSDTLLLLLLLLQGSIDDGQGDREDRSKWQQYIHSRGGTHTQEKKTVVQNVN